MLFYIEFSELFLKTAAEKKKMRETDIDKFFPTNIYSNLYDLVVPVHSELDYLFKLQKCFLKGEVKATVDDYSELFDCIVETTEPFKSPDYEKKLKRLYEEYSTK